MSVTRNLLVSFQELLMRERIKMQDRNFRREWPLLNELGKGYNDGAYKLAKEAAFEDITFAEELMKLEERWMGEGVLRREETFATQMGWRTPTSRGMSRYERDRYL